jgi:hypothetical protein
MIKVAQKAQGRSEKRRLSPLNPAKSANFQSGARMRWALFGAVTSAAPAIGAERRRDLASDLKAIPRTAFSPPPKLPNAAPIGRNQE